MLVSGADGVKLSDNLISGNDGHGVELSGGADDAIIDGNVIGANASGTSDLGNTGSGIHISNGDGSTIAEQRHCRQQLPRCLIGRFQYL